MKKFLLGFVFIFFILNSTVKAKTIRVVSLEPFSTQFPLKIYNVQLLEKVKLGNNIVLESGAIIAGRVVKVEKPRLGSRNAYFEFIPTLISYKGVIQDVSNPNYVAQIVGYKHIDPEKAAMYMAKSATNFLTMGASVGISFVQGLMEAEEGYRFKSGLMRTYKDSPLSFIGLGNELEIEIGDILKFKLKKVKPIK